VERDLAALEDKVTTLGQEAARLCGIHPDHADQIKAKHQEIVNNWERLIEKAKVICRALHVLINTESTSFGCEIPCQLIRFIRDENNLLKTSKNKTPLFESSLSYVRKELPLTLNVLSN